MFRVTQPYLNLLVKPRIFVRCSGKNYKSVILIYWACGSWDSLFPKSMSPTANLWVQNTILFFMTSLQYNCILGLAKIKTLHPKDKIVSEYAGCTGNKITDKFMHFERWKIKATRNVSMGHRCPRYCQICINKELSLTKGNNSWRHNAIWAILKLENIMVLNNVTKFHRIIIKAIHLKRADIVSTYDFS